MVLNTEWAQVEVIDLINDGTGLAFGIIGGRSTGVVVKTIIPGGVADRDGRLRSGDHILQIGEVNLRGLGSEQVAAVLRQCGVHVRMVVARPVESTSADYKKLGSHAPIVPTKILGDPIELDKHLNYNGYGELQRQNPSNSLSTPFIFSGHHAEKQSHTISGMVDVVRNPQPIGTVPNLSTSLPIVPIAVDSSNSEPETETYAIDLVKDELGLGITVAGYVCEKEEISGIFVKSISKGSAADLAGRIKINDRITEVNGATIVGHNNHEAVEILRKAGVRVRIQFERYLRGPKYEQLQMAIRANEHRPISPPSPSASSLPKIPLSLVHMSSLGIEPEPDSRTSFDFDSAVLIDDDSTVDAGTKRKSLQFSICSQELIHSKWLNVFPDDVQIVIAEMTKEATSGLGISLEGTVDVEDGKEVRPHHYIRNILPHGPVGLNGILQSGDELLEVNGIDLLGLNHVAVVAILKQLPSLVIMVCARYSVHSRIIDTSQHREAFQARNILAGSFNTLISEKLVKAKSDTSIASTIASEPCCSMGSRSRSLELLAGLPMWSTEYTVVVLNKGEHGLGFSILDYQDPLNPQETVIVIRSLVPGGVAQTDGRLIPGDRLIAVNDVDVEHAVLDKAVQVLKGAPKGSVKITVAKPLSGKDAGSHHSQDTEDDQTYMEDFQECIEEYQECLEVVQICIEDDRPPLPPNVHKSSKDEAPSSELDTSYRSTCDISAKSTNNIPRLTKVDSGSERECTEGYETCLDDSFSEEVAKTPTNSHMPPVISTHTVESLELEIEQVSKELAKISKKKEKLEQQEPLEESLGEVGVKKCRKPLEFSPIVEEDNDLPLLLPLHQRQRLTSTSEPCLRIEHQNHICLDTNPSDEEQLKSYDALSNTSGKEDEFFLLQYPDDLTEKCRSEPNVLENHDAPVTYRYKIEEYYNDIEDCLEAYQQAKAEDDQADNADTDAQIQEIIKTEAAQEEEEERARLKELEEQRKQEEEALIRKLAEEREEARLKQEEEEARKRWEIENEQRRMEKLKKLGIEKIDSTEKVASAIHASSKSKSAPEILDNSFVTLTYDPGPAAAALAARRKSDYPDEKQLRDNVTNSAVMRSIGVDSMLGKHWGDLRTITIHRERGASLGISIVGGKVDLHKDTTSSETILGIFVKNVVPDSPAGRDGQLKTGDRILEVSGTSLKDVSHEKAVEVIKYAKNPIVFVVQSLITQVESTSTTPIKVNTPQPAIKQNKVLSSHKSVEFKDTVEINDIAPRKQKTVESSEESDDEEDERNLTGRTVSAKGQEIDRASAANIKRSKEEAAADPEDEDDFGYTTNKVKKKYANLGQNIVMVQLERSVGQGLGLSLAGHKDRNCMAVFVCGINPAGAAFRAGGVHVGDEILEVNGVVLHGRCHLNASAIIKGLSGPIFKLIILRRKAAIDDIAVRPITQFPVSLAEEASEESFSNYPNVRTVSIKKGTQSLGIMIIEGKHAEVGQGIFISDIQEGSSAEKAGLEIGEMILAVNKDSLLGSNYDTAANLLKRTEGLVTLVVSNPGKKNTATDDKNGAGLKASSATSRPTTPTPEPPADPLTCQIVAGRDTTIEVASDNKALGLCFVGGKDTPITGGIMVVDVYPGGAAEKDGRLQPGDQILDVNGTSLKDVTHNFASQALRQTLPKMKIVVHRHEKQEYDTIEVEFAKKPGKGLGLSIAARKCGKGVYVTEILNGGCVDVDGKVMRGDLLVAVNGQNLNEMSGEEVGAVLKTLTGKVNLKLHRYKATGAPAAAASASGR